MFILLICICFRKYDALTSFLRNAQLRHAWCLAPSHSHCFFQGSSIITAYFNKSLLKTYLNSNARLCRCKGERNRESFIEGKLIFRVVSSGVFYNAGKRIERRASLMVTANAEKPSRRCLSLIVNKST